MNNKYVLGIVILSSLLFASCYSQREITKADNGKMYLNGPAYSDYMEVGYEYAYLFKPPFQYDQEVTTTTNGYVISPDGLLHYGIMSGWRNSKLRSK